MTARSIAKKTVLAVAAVLMVWMAAGGAWLAVLWHSAKQTQALCNGIAPGMSKDGAIASARRLGAEIVLAPDEVVARQGKCSCYIAVSAKTGLVEKTISGCSQ